MEQPNTNGHDAYYWLQFLDNRERMEVLHALDYVARFNHGTSGHLGLTTLAKVASVAAHVLNVLYIMGQKVDEEEFEIIFNRMTIAPKPNKE